MELALRNTSNTIAGDGIQMVHPYTVSLPAEDGQQYVLFPDGSIPVHSVDVSEGATLSIQTGAFVMEVEPKQIEATVRNALSSITDEPTSNEDYDALAQIVLNIRSMGPSAIAYARSYFLGQLSTENRNALEHWKARVFPALFALINFPLEKQEKK